MIKKISVAIIFLALLLLPGRAFAAEDLPAGEAGFATSYDVVYDIDASGVTTVTQKITLRNLTSQYFADQFKLTIGATQISDIKAQDASGVMEVNSEQQDQATTITVKFNQQVAGINKTLPWTLQFRSRDFAQNLGKIWEVRAPKISPTQNLENYNLTISVPTSFGEPTLISPTPKSQSISFGKLLLTFEKNQLTQSGVLSSFGTKQLFDFDLTYHLQNTALFPVLTNIAIPPDSAYQDVVYHRIEPPPLNVTLDDDGNYLAWFRLSRGQKLDVKVIGSAKLYSHSKALTPSLSQDLKRKYTSSDRYWEKDHPQIVSKLSEILGSNPPKESREKIKLIYRYVVNWLKYDASRLQDNIDRLGAVTVLNNPDSAVCMEFTDLFIALARAAGIPARELDGYAYSANPTLRPLSLTKDILHAWPEYFDERLGWVMVDPTWENTTGGVDYFTRLDLNHFVFSVKGSSSVRPLPAGSYKYIGQDSHDVKVNLTEVDFLGKPQIDVDIHTANPILAGFPAKLKVKIANRGSASYPSTTLSIRSNKLSILLGQNLNLGPIPSFGSAFFEFPIRTKSLFEEFDDQIVVVTGGQEFKKEVMVKPFILFQKVPLIGMGIILTIIAVYLVVLGGLIYRKKFLKRG